MKDLLHRWTAPSLANRKVELFHSGQLKLPSSSLENRAPGRSYTVRYRAISFGLEFAELCLRRRARKGERHIHNLAPRYAAFPLGRACLKIPEKGGRPQASEDDRPATTDKLSTVSHPEETDRNWRNR